MKGKTRQSLILSGDINEERIVRRGEKAKARNVRAMKKESTRRERRHGKRCLLTE